MPAMNLAITGGSGFIGTWFVKRFQNRYRFVILGRSKQKPAWLPAGLDCRYCATDYSVDSLSKCLDGVEGVLHLAARKVIREQDRFEEYVNANLLLTQRLFEACRILNIKNIVNSSSRLVYSESNSLPWSEDTDPHPVTYYGISKLAAEKLAHYYNCTYSMNIKSLRLAQVIGCGAGSESVVGKFMRSAAAKEKLTVFGTGAGRREYIYIEDAVRALHCAISKSEVSGVFNIGSGVNISYRELAILINNIYNNAGNIVFLHEKPEDCSVGLMDISKAANELGFVPRWTMEAALRDMQKRAAVRRSH